MARKRGTDWEGIIRAVGALVVLGVAMIFLQELSGGKSQGTAVAGPLAAMFSVVTMGGVILVVLAFAAVIIFIIWKVVNARPRWDRVEPHSISTQFTDTHAAERVLTVSDRLEVLDWFQLEKLVGTLFAAGGYHVLPRGGANADGGIDLVVENNEGRVAVQCKHWATWKCGVAVVRELMGAMLHEGILQGYLVAREITPDARELAAKHGIGITDREELVKWIQGSLDAENTDVRHALENPEKLCPKCGGRMVKRTARKGKQAGSVFWGCSNYPGCRQIMKT